MAHFDVFNGDADGMCALHQLRLAEPRAGQLITGAKRDINLLARVPARAGDSVAVFDISLARNRTDLGRLLAAGVRVDYFDHHFAGDIPRHPLLDAHIDTSAGICTSSIVDRVLGGPFRPWAVVGAFGDNLPQTARALAQPLGLSDSDLARLQLLGECLNYNSYGESEADLNYPPAALYRAIATFVDPFDFLAQRPEFERLRAGMEQDLASARRVAPHRAWPGGDTYILPDADWSRRVAGPFANILARESPAAVHAVVTPHRAGGYEVSVRFPADAVTAADRFCREFPTGGGRKQAAGIDELPAQDLERFVARFREVTRASAG